MTAARAATGAYLRPVRTIGGSVHGRSDRKKNERVRTETAAIPRMVSSTVQSFVMAHPARCSSWRTRCVVFETIRPAFVGVARTIVVRVRLPVERNAEGD